MLARKAATKVKGNKSQPSSQSKSKKQLITQFLSGVFGTEMQKSAEGDASTSTMDTQEDNCSDLIRMILILTTFLTNQLINQ